VIVNLAELQRTHAQFIKANERMLEDAAEFALEDVKKRYDKRLGFTPFHLGTKSKVVRTKNGRIARIVDKGTRRHVILPRKGRFLKFIGRNGKMVFTKKVNHPGSGPFKFGPKVARGSHRLMGRFIEAEAARIARRFSS
jgi:hypothetical protein